MVIFNAKHIDRIIVKVGNSVNIIIKSDITYDDWGNQYSNISSSISTTAIVNDISASEEFNTDGVLVPDDKIFFFESTTEGLTNDNTINYANNSYNIIKIIPYVAENNQQQYEVWGKRL